MPKLQQKKEFPEDDYVINKLELGGGIFDFYQRTKPPFSKRLIIFAHGGDAVPTTLHDSTHREKRISPTHQLRRSLFPGFESSFTINNLIQLKEGKGEHIGSILITTPYRLTVNFASQQGKLLIFPVYRSRVKLSKSSIHRDDYGFSFQERRQFLSDQISLFLTPVAFRHRSIHQQNEIMRNVIFSPVTDVIGQRILRQIMAMSATSDGKYNELLAHYHMYVSDALVLVENASYFKYCTLFNIMRDLIEFNIRAPLKCQYTELAIFSCRGDETSITHSKHHKQRNYVYFWEIAIANQIGELEDEISSLCARLGSVSGYPQDAPEMEQFMVRQKQREEINKRLMICQNHMRRLYWHIGVKNTRLVDNHFLQKSHL